MPMAVINKQSLTGIEKRFSGAKLGAIEAVELLKKQWNCFPLDYKWERLIKAKPIPFLKSFVKNQSEL